MSKNRKPLNQVFNRTPVISMTPDDSWPSPVEFIGVEIEVENPSSYNEFARGSTYWTTHVDHSLRNGVEFVCAAPYGGKQLSAALDEFFNSGITYDCSPRTSIHIHINASDTMGIDDLRATLALMYVIEPAVFRWADDNRKYCGYCNPLTDLPPERLIGAMFQNGDEGDLIRAVNPGQNADRYYGFNMAALARHGTLEFRYFPCVTEQSVVINWIKFVMEVKLAAMAADDVRSMLVKLADTESLRAFLAESFPSVYTYLDGLMDYEDAAGRARYLLGAMLTAPDTTPLVVRASTNRSRGFRAFIEKSFPNLAAAAATVEPMSPSPAEAAIAEQIRLYRQAANDYRRQDVHNPVAAMMDEVAQTSRYNLVQYVQASAEANGVTIAEYIAATNLNDVI